MERQAKITTGEKFKRFVKNAKRVSAAALVALLLTACMIGCSSPGANVDDGQQSIPASADAVTDNYTSDNHQDDSILEDTHGGPVQNGGYHPAEEVVGVPVATAVRDTYWQDGFQYYKDDNTPTGRSWEDEMAQAGAWVSDDLTEDQNVGCASGWDEGVFPDEVTLSAGDGDYVDMVIMMRKR